MPSRSAAVRKRIAVGERDFVQVQRRWRTTHGKFRAHGLDVFRPHATDQTNGRPVFADVGDDPQRHGAPGINVQPECNR